MHNYLPHHVAIIMDGNGRWAAKRHQPRIMGHRAGVESLRKVIKAALEHNISVLSLFAFSTENWQRPSSEVEGLMNLFLSALVKEDKKLQEYEIQLRIIGDLSRFSAKLQKQIHRVHELTATNKKMKLVIAANYGGRWDITQAVQSIAAKIKINEIQPDAITEELIQQHLATADIPDPDLFIRTSGELRVSNFFLWQLAYTEFYFTETLWPDFDEHEFKLALDVFIKRERRFGRADDVKESV